MQIMQNADKITVFIDGACTNNGKPNALGGIGIYFPGGQYQNLSEKLSFERATNMRAELGALLRVFQLTSEYEGELIIYTDSEYCINVTLKWMYLWRAQGNNGQKNMDIIDKIYEQVKDRRFQLLHVRGHQKLQGPYNSGDSDQFKIHGNIQADKLAVQGTKLQ